MICWYCEKETPIKKTDYGDHFCPHCGATISIYDLEDESQTKEVSMGKLAERAREKSPFIRLEVGQETPVLVYKGWEEAKDRWNNDTFRYRFELITSNGIVNKTLDNRSQAFAELMDAIPFGSKVIIKREPKYDEAGNIVENKSVWSVKKAD